MNNETQRQWLFDQSRRGDYTNRSNYTTSEHRPSWMSDEQWRQAVAYINGEAVPFDHELLDGLRAEGQLGRMSNAQAWVYSHVPSVMVYEGFAKWCELIEGTIDPDLKVDEGL